MAEEIGTITPRTDEYGGYTLKTQYSCGCKVELFYALKESAEKDRDRLPNKSCPVHNTTPYTE